MLERGDQTAELSAMNARRRHWRQGHYALREALLSAKTRCVLADASHSSFFFFFLPLFFSLFDLPSGEGCFAPLSVFDLA